MINRKTNIIHVFLRHVLPAIEELSEGRAREINARTLVRFRALFQAGNLFIYLFFEILLLSALGYRSLCRTTKEIWGKDSMMRECHDLTAVGQTDKE